MPLDMAAREVLSTDRSMLAAAFIFLAFAAALRLSVRRRDLALPGVTVWLWFSAVGAQLSLALGEVEDEIGWQRIHGLPCPVGSSWLR